MHMADACRLICQQYLIQVALNETGVRADEDVEYVHEMRVAVRRMRVALRLYGAYFQPDAIHGFVDDLGRTGRLLGAVRDMDVALAKARHAHKATGQPGKSLLQAWQQSATRPAASCWTGLTMTTMRRLRLALLLSVRSPARRQS